MTDKTRLRAIKITARVHAADHERHPCLCCLMRRFGYTLDEALAFIEECRSEMWRFGRPPTAAQCDCPPGGPFRS